MYPEKVDSARAPWRNAVKNCHVVLTAYNGTKIPQYGAIQLQRRYDGGKWIDTDFNIVDSEGPAILGLRSSLDHRLVTLYCEIKKLKGDSSLSITTNRVSKPDDSVRCVNTVDELMAIYPGQFDKIGKFPGEYHIILEEESHPVIHVPCKCPIQLQDELKQELDEVELKGVIKKMMEPTDWVNHGRFKTEEQKVASVSRPQRSEQSYKTVSPQNPDFGGNNT